MKLNSYPYGFTLVEILVSMLIVSLVLVWAFQTLSATGIAKVKLIERTRIEKEAFFASERFVDLIKKWGNIDYEEYWNRKSLGIGYANGYYSTRSGFWNEGIRYYCLSPNGGNMGTGWCLTSNNRTLWSTSIVNYTWNQQRYGQYKLQFINYNSDWNGDFWDVWGDTVFIWDDDDLFLGIGPSTFTSSSDVWELYLINASWDERTFFRWKVSLDSAAPSWYTCGVTWKALTGSGCIGTVQILKLQWKDTSNNGEIDTWYIHPDFVPDGSVITAASSGTEYWQDIFSNTLHVSQLEFFLSPEKKLDYSWGDNNTALQIAPYLQLKMRFEPSWKEKRKIRWVVPSVDIKTTIQLSQVDLY